MLHIKYQGSWPCDIREDISMISLYEPLIKHVTSGAGSFLAPGAFFEQTW